VLPARWVFVGPPRSVHSAAFQAGYPSLVRALYLLTGDQDEAEELAQATMARIYERWDRSGSWTRQQAISTAPP
jgi:DNA-directed RNA polymerase specialized sigma24 family protein